MTNPIQSQYNTGVSLLANVKADVNALMGGEKAETGAANSNTASGGCNGGANGGLKDILGDLTKLLKNLIKALGGNEGGCSGNGGVGTQPSPSCASPISGEARIWGDPHFEGADGGKYDVQGEAGKTYNLLSDKNFQMNGTFESWGSQGATVVGQVGINTGSDQVEINKDGKVMVNGQELKDGERFELADGGFVEKNGKNIKLESGEWKVDFQTRGDHINMDISTDNAIADGVKPHGLIGQTFDGDGEARNGDRGTGAQGGGAIEGSDGITQAGDHSTIQSYEVDNIHDRNFTEFNQFFDKVESSSEDMANELKEMMMNAFSMMAQSMMAMMRQTMGGVNNQA